MTRPGDLLRRMAARLLSPRTMASVIDPLLADLQADYQDAVRQGSVSARWRVRLAGYLIFLKTIAMLGWSRSHASSGPGHPRPVRSGAHDRGPSDRAGFVLGEQVWRDLRLALRRRRATPIFTVFAVVSLALGLGVTTGVYSVVDALLWQPVGIPDVAHLVVITARPVTYPAWQPALSEPDFVDLRASLGTTPSLAASTPVYESVNLGGITEALLAEAVSGNYFDTVGVRAVFGRTIQPADDRADAEPVVVLAYDFWRAKTGADASVVGRTILVGSQPAVVVGVASAGFTGLHQRFGSNSDGWIALAMRDHLRTVTAGAPTAARRDHLEMTVFARLSVDQPVERVAAEVEGRGRAMDAAVPLLRRQTVDGPLVPTPRRWSATTMAAITSQDSTATGSVGAGIIALVGLVLIVACTNLANLMLGRGTSRQHECAVRLALGASRWRLVREQFMESVILAVFGGGGALLVARFLLQLFTTDLPLSGNRIITLQPHLNAATVVAAAVALVASLVVFGLGPAMQLAASSLRERLAGEAAQGSVKWRTRRSLIAWQVTISTALIVIAAVSVRVIVAEALHDPGFDLSHLALAVPDFWSQHWDEARGRRTIDAIESAARAERGFRAVAVSSGTPLGLTIRQFCQLAATDQPLRDRRDGTEAGLMVATPGIFQTLGVPLARGRGFDERDTSATTPVIVVSGHVARAIFGSIDVVGRRVLYRGTFNTLDTKTIKTLEIVGVAGDTDTQSLYDRSLGSVYIPLAQQYEASLVLIGRTSGDPSTMVKAFAAIGRKADPDLPIAFASTGPLMLTGAYVLLRVVAWLSAGLAVLALGLAMIGLYGVLSHLVTRRTREIGIRLALGAGTRQVRWMIVLDGLRPVWAGLVLGIGLGVLARLVLRAVYVGANISPIDPFAFGIAVATLLTAGLIACGLPARRASRVDPNVALREM
jgi:predicted permease